MGALEYRFGLVTARSGAEPGAFAGRHGRFGYCSCMRWRLPSAQSRQIGRDGRAAALRELVSAGQPAGVLAYQNHDAMGGARSLPGTATPRSWLRR